MNAVLYARVSSEKQAENDLSISAQLKALRAYAEKNGWTIIKEYVDEAESARSANRPAFQEMIAHAKAKTKAFEAILIWKHSRFARNREDAIIYKSLLRKFGVSVISMNEQVVRCCLMSITIFYLRQHSRVMCMLILHFPI